MKFKSITNAGVTFIHIIHLGWIRNLSTNTLTFDIVQFFPSLNYCLLTFILKEAGFNNYIISFFANYLMDRKINYLWKNFSSPTFDVNIGMSQGSVLSPILLALYLSPFLYILEKNLNFLIFWSLLFLSLMMGFSFLRANYFTFLTAAFFVATMS